jgi:hypothetical protein
VRSAGARRGAAWVSTAGLEPEETENEVEQRTGEAYGREARPVQRQWSYPGPKE